MPAGANPTREKEYRKLESRFKKEGRYRGREDEVASRIVNKQRAQYGETKSAREQDRAGKSPDRGLPIKDYETLTIPEVRRRLGALSRRDIEKLRDFETGHRSRKGLLRAFESILK